MSLKWCANDSAKCSTCLLYTSEAADEEAARKRDEQWRNEVVEHFAESFAHHFNDTAAKEDGLQPRATLTEADPLFDELTKLGDALGYPGAWDAVSSNETAPRLSWREAEKKLCLLYTSPSPRDRG